MLIYCYFVINPIMWPFNYFYNWCSFLLVKQGAEARFTADNTEYIMHIYEICLHANCSEEFSV